MKTQGIKIYNLENSFFYAFFFQCSCKPLGYLASVRQTSLQCNTETETATTTTSVAFLKAATTNNNNNNNWNNNEHHQWKSRRKIANKFTANLLLISFRR